MEQDLKLGEANEKAQYKQIHQAKLTIKTVTTVVRDQSNYKIIHELSIVWSATILY